MLESISNLLSSFYTFPIGVRGWTLLALRVGVGILFILHGYPKLIHLQTWAKALKMPVYLCFLSASSMFLGGFCLILGFLTPLASIIIMGSMVFALILEILQGLPLVAPDPYLIPDGEYEGANGKGEPPSQEKALIFILMLLVIAIFGAGGYSIDAWLFGLD